MSLRFIIGRAGAGKTRCCLEEITARLGSASQEALVFLVPEQATFYMEKSLLDYAQIGGTMRAQVLSFQRLAWRVLQETGGGIYPSLSKEGKALILRRILEKERRGMRAFGRVLGEPGFIKELADLFTEFKQYGINRYRLAAAAAQLEGKGDKLADKLADLSLIYGEYLAFIEKQYLDTEEHLDLLARNMAGCSLLTGSEVWLDGFHGFTPQEYAIIRQLMLKVRRVTITLCLDPSRIKKRLPETDLFYPTWETYEKLQALAQEINCPQDTPVILDYYGEHRFSQSPELAYLEQSLVCPGGHFNQENRGVKLAAAVNRRAEVEGAARQILFLCREEGFRFRDIAVLVRNYSLYEGILPSVFASYGIPYFLDAKRSLEYHPLLDLLQGALEVVEKGWTFEPLFRYLKTDLVPISRQETDLLENYCLAYGIRGSRWTEGKDWAFQRRLTLGEDEEPTQEEEAEVIRINRARKKAAAALLKLEDNLRRAETVEEKARAVYDLLEELSVARKLEYWSNKATEEGNPEEALLHSQVWRRVQELLDQLVEVLGAERISLSEFNRLLEEGLENLELSLIPPGLDQVLVGSPDRSRNPNMKAIFVLGVNDGVLPGQVKDEGLITDQEKQTLASLDLTLAADGERRQYGEQFVVYTALTGASHYLWLSYPLADEEGKALSPSLLMERLGEIFMPEGQRDLTVLALDPEEDEMQYVSSPGKTLSILATRMRAALDGAAVNPLWFTVYNWYLEHPEWRSPLETVIAGLFPRPGDELLSRDLVKRLYGNRLLTSISRLEKYRACPFAHFLSYGLKIKERQEFKLKAPELGQLFHGALEAFHRRLQDAGLIWSELSLEQMEEMVDQILEHLVPLLQNELLLSTARYRYLIRKLRRIILRAVKVLQEHEKRGTFRPWGVEIIFGPGGQLPGLKLTLADGLEVVLQGRIDRVDQAADGAGNYFRVIDFKSGQPQISLLEIFYGLKLQLMAYLDVILTNAPGLIKGEALPGGVFYFKIKDPLIQGEGPLPPEEIEKKLLKELRMQGFLLKEPEVIRLMDKNLKGRSELVPVGLKDNEEVYREGEAALSLAEFQKLRRHVENIFLEISTEIMAGKVAAAPYRFRGKSPCSNCLYFSVCRFDPQVPGYNYRYLAEKKTQDLWNAIERGDSLGTE